uniref:Probable pectate lyase F n=1 Tax=Aphelenchoides avenae TaxID=70226 RepID=C9K4V8_APHAV|nr:pectate lyase [Aphelenchus avenae]BAI44500.1 pectate lyase [Aphelenchus avenae]
MFCRLSVVAVACLVGLSLAQSWPNPSSTKKVPSTIKVKKGQPYDGKNVRHTAGFGSGGQDEGQDPVFELDDGAVIKNVVLGAPAADGIHCKGSCSIENVWWEDVGEDAATFLGSSGATYTVSGGGAKKASDKVFQHNGGGTLTIRNFQVDTFGKLYRSCGNCKNNGSPRKVVIENVKATNGKALAGINANYGDQATLRNVQVSSSVKEICTTYTGNNNGKEPSQKAKYGPTQDGDGKYCVFKKSDIKRI